MRVCLPTAFLLACAPLLGCEPKPDDTGSEPVEEVIDLDGDGHRAEEDCDDEDPAVHPGADEVCNGIDDDCDGFVDDADPGVEGGSTFYPDGDGDGFGWDHGAVVACEEPSGFVERGGDCDDGVAAVNPAAEERCNDRDDDCDGEVDEEAADGDAYYADRDGDGYGDPERATRACEPPSGHVEDPADCDDGDATVFPGADERCDGVDDDCDGAVDEQAVDAPSWYRDGDGDGFGDPTVSTEACSAPAGMVADASDCDDGDAGVFPGAEEHCDEVDEDCDGDVDEAAVDASTWYADADGDGFGDAAAITTSCEAPSGYGSDDRDCDDGDAGVYPGADERCDGVDEDCDGDVDEAAVDALTWYADADGDGYGDSAITATACSVPSGYGGDGSDCDDADAAIHPGADEHCDGVDEDCDGDVDEAAVDVSTWYLDADGDGYGDAGSATTACSMPSGHTADASDCDDGDAAIHPAATEHCDGIDNDCDGGVDAAGLATWFDSAGTPTDLSATLGAGTASAPVALGMTRSGALNLCANTWYLQLEVAAPDLSIVGLSGSASTILQGVGTGSIVTALSGSSELALEGLTLRGGADSYGGGLDGGAQALDVSLDDVVIEGCSATSDGGGIYLAGSSLVADGLVLDGNQAGSSGGGLFLYGGSAELTDATVSGNSSGYIGGGLYLAVSSASLDGALVEGNASDYGGGLLLYYASVELSDSDVADNLADVWGGGVYLHDADIVMDASRVEGNQVAPGTTSGAGGGLASYYSSSITCTGSAAETAGVYGNHAYYGGGVYLYDAVSTVVSSACDWGTTSAGDDNWYGDISSAYFWAATWGADASFTCNGTRCW
jgi:hypothetical protein